MARRGGDVTPARGAARRPRHIRRNGLATPAPGPARAGRDGGLPCPGDRRPERRHPRPTPARTPGRSGRRDDERRAPRAARTPRAAAPRRDAVVARRTPHGTDRHRPHRARRGAGAAHAPAARALRHRDDAVLTPGAGPAHGRARGASGGCHRREPRGVGLRLRGGAHDGTDPRGAGLRLDDLGGRRHRGPDPRGDDRGRVRSGPRGHRPGPAGPGARRRGCARRRGSERTCCSTPGR